MKKIGIVILFAMFINHANTIGQTTTNTGLAFLSETKTTIEEAIIKMKQIPDSSDLYISVYNRLNNQYIKTSSIYQAYRSEMVSCILQNKSLNKAKKCLKVAAPDLKNSLNRLLSETDSAYTIYYKSKSIGAEDLASDIISGLIDGAIKIWNQVKDDNDAVKAALMAEIKSKQYDLLPFNVMLPYPKKPKGGVK